MFQHKNVHEYKTYMKEKNKYMKPLWTALCKNYRAEFHKLDREVEHGTTDLFLVFFLLGLQENQALVNSECKSTGAVKMKQKLELKSKYG